MQKSFFKRLFFISKENLDGKTLYPRVPDNELTRKGTEDAKTPRVCMSFFVEGCLRSITTTCLSQSFNIYTAVDIEEQYLPTEKEVPDAMLTGEVWVTQPVRLTYYGRLDLFSRVDTAPCMGYPSDSNKYGFVEVALYDYAVYAKSSFDRISKSSIEVIDQEEDDDFVKSLVPTDFTDRGELERISTVNAFQSLQDTKGEIIDG